MTSDETNSRCNSRNDKAHAYFLPTPRQSLEDLIARKGAAWGARWLRLIDNISRRQTNFGGWPMYSKQEQKDYWTKKLTSKMTIEQQYWFEKLASWDLKRSQRRAAETSRGSTPMTREQLECDEQFGYNAQLEH